MMGNMDGMMQIVKQLQEQLRNMNVKVSAGQGAVQIVMNGNQEVVQIHFKPDVLKDPSQLAQLTAEAFNEGMKESKKMVREELSKMTGGMGLPNIPGLV